VVDRQDQQTKMIAVSSVTTGRAGAAVAHPVEVVDLLLESHSATAGAGALGKSCLHSINVVNGPMVPCACGRIRVVTEEDELAVIAGAACPSKGGERSSPSQVKRRGIAEPLEKALELSCIGCLQVAGMAAPAARSSRARSSTACEEKS
jgi:hypothetical protein